MYTTCDICVYWKIIKPKPKKRRHSLRVNSPFKDLSDQYKWSGLLGQSSISQFTLWMSTIQFIRLPFSLLMTLSVVDMVAAG
jgi:hypothetical protein